jgi:hypothetical protein
MLVVIAIIAILASLLLPALIGAREKARRTSCMARLEQIGIGLNSYTGDYSEYLPGDPLWGYKSACHYAEDTSYATCATLCIPYSTGMVGQGPPIDCGPPAGTGAYSFVVGTYSDLSGSMTLRATTSGTGAVSGQHMVHIAWSTGDQPAMYFGDADYNPSSWYGVIAYNHDNVVTASTGGLTTVTTTGQTLPPNVAYPWSPGNLTLAPTGLGMLAAGNYIRDLQVYYCPTGQAYDADVESPMGGWQNGDMQLVTTLDGTAGWETFCGLGPEEGYVNTSLGNIKMLGGTDSYYLTHGDLTAVRWCMSINGNGSGPWAGNWGGTGLITISPFGCDGNGAPWSAMLPSYEFNENATSAPTYSTDPYQGSGVAIGSSYAYRNQSYTDAGMHIIHRLWSCGCAADMLSTNFPTLYIPGSGAADTTGTMGYYNRMPSPRFVQEQNACPERKTTKTLGSLAIASDRFDTHINKGFQLTSLAGDWALHSGSYAGVGLHGQAPSAYPGAGFYGHKVGYNVLFGDNHVAWNGDPQQWYVWEWNSVTTAVYGSMTNAITPWGLPAGNDAASDNDPCSGSMTGFYPGTLGGGAGMFTLFDDVANHEATSGFYIGEWISNYNNTPQP